jgi:hypothetical protein
MAVLGKFRQTPIERKRYTIDYSDWLGTGELLSSIVFASVPSSPTPAAVDSSALNSAHNGAVLFVSGGVDGVTYQILVTAVTDLGQIKEDEFFIVVKNP